ncbi:DivIVA domain-containing protein [Pseudolactococcus plantarum]|uniref:Cell division protein DivIVA n=1 Tax=Pseudolactococcus plantarum TaxID=1365 RepID=A0A2A5RXC2_9LACT|nr:DivIVA domain-containing protein [Lactococcus plantarum]PCS05885.1 cell division protein DivIVA [Lactococcus plantarum]HCN74354.1 DivIVA domain-containing protein [Lactococcus sp.]
MSLNSLDVQNKTFATKVRGYNKVDVDDFLDLIIRDYDEFAEKIKDQDRELKSLRERVESYEGMKDSLNKSIVVAQSAADNLKEHAINEANAITVEAGQKAQYILEAAKKEAGVILNSASDDARQLVKETEELKRKMRIYHQRMALMVESQLEGIKSHEWEEILKPTTTYIGDGVEKLKEIIDTHEGNTVQISQTVNEVSAILDAQEAAAPVAEPVTADVDVDTDKKDTETEA